MEGFLSEAQRNYVLFHLRNHAEFNQDLLRRFVFRNQPDEAFHSKIVFNLSAAPYDPEKIITIGSIPVLFPLSEKMEFYCFDTHGNLVFEQDILRSIFYLLSGYQEFANRESKDILKRFSYEDSIQYKLGIVHLPVVNYYFEIIVEALQSFCERHHIRFKKRRLFQTFGFQLSHDVDRIDLYTPAYLGYKLKEILGMVKTPLPVKTNLNLFFTGLLKYLNVYKNDNPYWNFHYLRALERKHAFKSIFFFLDQGVRHSDAYYSFREKRVEKLMRFVVDENCEIGLHGTVESVSNEAKMASSRQKLIRASLAPVIGNRQHRLLWNHPGTARIETRVGIQYDSTLGFAAHEGFRNSYCYPFKLFDFQNDRMIDLWEFPLTVMDVTLMSYRQYTPGEALQACVQIINEARRFGGLFTLLWHNSFFDETTYPGIHKLYEDILQTISDQQPECILGHELLSRMKNLTATL